RGDTPEDGAEGHEVRTGDRGDDERQGRLPAAWRPPEDHRPDPVAGDRLRQHRVRPEEVLLTEDPLERARPHPIGERSPTLHALFRGGAEQSLAGVWERPARSRGHGENVARFAGGSPGQRIRYFIPTNASPT